MRTSLGNRTGAFRGYAAAAALLMLFPNLPRKIIWAPHACAKEIVLENDTVFSSAYVIPSGTTVTIAAGVKILMNGYCKIRVSGLLIAEGTPSDPIIFGPFRRTGGPSDPPAWKGIELTGEDAHARFRHCRFEGAFKHLVWGARPTFDSCAFMANHYALYCTRKAAPHVKNCLFTHNTHAIVIDFAMPLLLNNTISFNAVGIYRRFGGEAMEGKNTLYRNRIDTRTETPVTRRAPRPSVKAVWELLSQLY